ncbi:unknown [Clostridium sp. CAG:149]|nr:unknown [Clostridium sp. CAG:149]
MAAEESLRLKRSDPLPKYTRKCYTKATVRQLPAESKLQRAVPFCSVSAPKDRDRAKGDKENNTE